MCNKNSCILGSATQEGHIEMWGSEGEVMLTSLAPWGLVLHCLIARSALGYGCIILACPLVQTFR